MVNIPTESGFVLVGAASGQIFASQVGSIGLVGSFGGMALGTPVIVVSGALAGAAVQGMIDGIESGDVTVLGITTVGSVIGAGFAAGIGNVGVGVAGTAFGVGMGTMALTGGVFALGVYQLIKMFVNNGQAESFDGLLERMETQVSEQEFYIQALLELDPVLQELTWYQKFSELDTDQELQAMKQMLDLDLSVDSKQTYEWQTIEKPQDLKAIKAQLENQLKDQSVKSIYSSLQDEKENLIKIDLPEFIWQATELRHFENPSILSLTVSKDSHFLYSAHANGTVGQWDLKRQQHSLTYISGGEEMLAVTISPDCQKLFAAGCERFITAWHTQSRTISIGFRSLNLADNGSHKGIIYCLACSPDGKILASGGSDGIIKIWDAVKNTWQRNLNGHQGSVKAIAFSLDGQRIISGGEDCTIRLWQTNNWKNSLILGEHPATITALDLTNNGQFLVSASLDGTVKIWDIDNHSFLTSFQAHDGNLLGIAVNPVTNTIATATAKEVRLWDWQTHQCTERLTGCFPIIFSPDGQVLITVNPSPRKGLKIWQFQIKPNNDPTNVTVSFDFSVPWWEVLQVSPDADRQTVKAAYYALAKKFHPDQNGAPHRESLRDHHQKDQLSVTMQQINHAYDQFRRQKS